MATIRDLVGAIRQREGVEAVVVVGRDGLLIEGQAAPLDPEHIAAHVPAVVSAADELGGAARRGALATAVLEHEHGVAVLAAMSREAVLVVLVQPTANVAQLLLELRRNRDHIAALV